MNAPGGPRLLHHTRDEWGDIEIQEHDGLRELRFGTAARQTCMRPAAPHTLVLSYTRAMMAALMLLPEPPRRVLLIGLGGGALIRFLHHHLPECEIDAVERRAALIPLARRFFGVPDTPGVRLHAGDGGAWLRARPAAERFDLMLIDAFDGDGMAPLMQERDFWAECAGHLAPGGLCGVNLWSGPAAAAVSDLLDELFPAQMQLPVPRRGNLVAFALTTPPPPWPALTGRAEALGARYGLELPAHLTALRWRQRRRRLWRLFQPRAASRRDTGT